MKQYLLQFILAFSLLANTPFTFAASQNFSFGVIQYATKNAQSELLLRTMLSEMDASNSAFVVVNGIKNIEEPCSDKIYRQRKTILDSTKSGVILSLAASDWAECKSMNGKSSAIGRLGLLRDLFFANNFSLGEHKIPVVRQSASAKFRSYVENARWEVGNIMFATINLPRNNNHYLFDAGRNNEFEDRLIANRDWLNRIFLHATRKKMRGIVLFSDANPLSKPSLTYKRDGFLEIRQQLTVLASKFSGKILVIHGQSSRPDHLPSVIAWRGNLGVLSPGETWLKLTVDSFAPQLFHVIDYKHELTDS